MARENYAEIGARIRSVRASRGMTQETLAEGTDLSTGYISALERAHKGASIGALERIARVLDVPLGWLVGGGRDNEHEERLERLLADCSPCEKEIILDTSSALKQAIRKHSDNS